MSTHLKTCIKQEQKRTILRKIVPLSERKPLPSLGIQSQDFAAIDIVTDSERSEDNDNMSVQRESIMGWGIYILFYNLPQDLI